MAQHILVVDDNPDNRQLVTWILEDEGYQITCSPDAEEALVQLESCHYDMVLMDISLPGMDGKQATQLIRQNVKYGKIPILALTAHAIMAEKAAIMASGVNAVITKPLDEAFLLATMAKYLK
jgi:two-component system cell cycle response regulator DivK|tara:strand:+ start:302 stop:667 length:366 start_codon:yes stop_codon:yes gene_type:complete